MRPNQQKVLDEIKQLGYTLSYDPPPVPTRQFDWHFAHEDYDGAPDSMDTRCGSAASPEEALNQIIDVEYENGDIE